MWVRIPLLGPLILFEKTMLNFRLCEPQPEHYVYHDELPSSIFDMLSSNLENLGQVVYLSDGDRKFTVSFNSIKKALAEEIQEIDEELENDETNYILDFLSTLPYQYIKDKDKQFFILCYH